MKVFFVFLIWSNKLYLNQCYKGEIGCLIEVNKTTFSHTLKCTVPVTHATE